MQNSISTFKYLNIILLVIIIACENPTDNNRRSSQFTFGTFDIGQGLAQIGIVENGSIIWDLGPPAAAQQLLSSYRRLGSPFIHFIIISHSDNDHRGGLAELPQSINFSGQIITSPYEDTALIRAESNEWQSEISFRTITQGDTLGVLKNVYIECIWPPSQIDETIPFTESALKNKYSLSFILRHEHNSVLITSDIDTFATEQLSMRYKYSLASDILVVPHHGSKSAVDPVFYGYVNPDNAVISCGKQPNQYGHPADEVIDLLFQMDIKTWKTYELGDIIVRSNGEYWQWKD